MIFSVDIVLELHQRLIEVSGGKPGLRDFASLDAAVSCIYQTFDRKELYSTIEEKASMLAFALTKNHPFFDGNKRIAMHMLAVFLRFHDIPYNPTNQAVIDVGFALAKEDMTYDQLLAWVQKTTKKSAQ